MSKKTIERKNMTQKIGGKITRQPDSEDAGQGVFFWWKQFDIDSDEKDEQLGFETESTIRFIQRNSSQRMDQLVFSTRLYSNNPAYNVTGAAFSRSSSASPNPTGSRMSFNLCSSVVDTLTSQVAKNKVVPTFITSGGVWGMQRKAEKLSKFTEGLFYEEHAHEKITYQARDAGVWGDGYLHPYRNSKDRAAIERVLPHEIVFDLVESMTGNLRQIHRVYLKDRGQLAYEHPEYREEIEQAPPASSRDIGAKGTAADLVLVTDSWHLRSGEDEDDGVFVRILSGTAQVIKKKKWDYDYFPFVDLEYSKRLIGGGGQGACERLQNLQGEINRMLITIQKSWWMGSTFKILSHINDKIPSQHFNNEVGPIIKWAGDVPPNYIAPQPVQTDAYQYVDSLIAKGYQQEGISQLSASNVKPLGINSGTALRTYDTIAEDRQLFFGQRVEQSALEVTRQCIDIVKEVYKEKGKYEVKFPNTNFVESIDWSDINLEMDEYWLKAFPTSSLPQEPAAKLETVTEYMQAGLISPRAGRRLLSMPDVEMSDKLANAAEELICKSIEDILYDGKKDVRPDSEWDLQLAKKISLEYMNFAKLNDCPEKKLKLLREFMSYIDDELGLTAPPVPMGSSPVPGAGPTVPMANPLPTPQSGLIPNVAGVA